MAILADWLNDGTLPQSKASGAWNPSAFNLGRFRFTWTPTNPSTHASWRPTGSAEVFFGLITTNDANGGGVWLRYVPSTGVHSIVVAGAGSGAVISGAVIDLTWSGPVTIDVDQSAASATLTISGALTGNGTATYARENILTGPALYWGAWGGGGGYNLLASSTSDIDDAAATTHVRSGGADAVASMEATPLRTFGRSGGASASATMSAAPAGGPYERSGSATATATMSAQPLVTHVRSGSATATPTMSATPAGGFERGAYGSARVLYGTAAGTVSVTLTTAAGGSTVLACVGGRLADLATAMTDSRGNTWTLLYTEEYARWPGYGLRVYRCIGLDGGAGHVFSQQFGQTAGFDEATIAVYEQRGAAHVESTSMVERAIGATVATGAVTSQAACAWVVFFSGDAPTGATSVLTPDNGLAILDQSTGIDHPNGYVPIVILAANKPSGSHASTIGISPSQGAIIFAAAVQAVAVIERSGGADTVATMAAQPLVTHVRAGGATATATMSAAPAATISRSGSATATATMSATALVRHVRAGSSSADGAMSAAPLVTFARAGEASALATLAVVDPATHVRSGGADAAATMSAAPLRTMTRSGGASASATMAVATSSRPPRSNYSTAPGAAMPSELVAGDLEPDLLIPLLEPHPTIAGARQPIDLTNAVSVSLVWRVPGTTGPELVLPAEVQGDPTLGQVAHTWAAGETSVAGLHLYRVRITWPGDQTQHVPSSGTYTLLVSSATI